MRYHLSFAARPRQHPAYLALKTRAYKSIAIKTPKLKDALTVPEKELNGVQTSDHHLMGVVRMQKIGRLAPKKEIKEAGEVKDLPKEDKWEEMVKIVSIK